MLNNPHEFTYIIQTIRAILVCVVDQVQHLERKKQEIDLK